MKISIRQLKALIRESVMEVGMGNASEPMPGGSDEEKERIAAMIQDELKNFMAQKKQTTDNIADMKKQTADNIADMEEFQRKINRGFESLLMPRRKKEDPSLPLAEARKLRSMIRATIRNTTRR